MFVYNGDNETVKKAVKYANSETLINYILLEIENKTSFDMSTAEPAYISDELKKLLKFVTIEIELYKPVYRWSKAIGYFTPEKPKTIHFNVYKLTYDISLLVGNFYHEAIHILDNFDNKHSYGHGSNNPSGKGNTAPYFIGSIARNYILGFEDFNNKDNGAIEYYIPWYKRLINYFRG